MKKGFSYVEVVLAAGMIAGIIALLSQTSGFILQMRREQDRRLNAIYVAQSMMEAYRAGGRQAAVRHDSGLKTEIIEVNTGNLISASVRVFYGEEKYVILSTKKERGVSR